MMLGKMKGMMRRVRRKKGVPAIRTRVDRWKNGSAPAASGRNGDLFLMRFLPGHVLKVVVAGPVFNFILAWFCAFFRDQLCGI